jgi:hypothetical protein
LRPANDTVLKETGEKSRENRDDLETDGHSLDDISSFPPLPRLDVLYCWAKPWLTLKVC